MLKHDAQRVAPRNCVPVFCHVDLDCFYCQVEQRRLGVGSEHPLAVQQWESLIAVNYPARAFSIRRGENVRRALALCPNLKLVHVETLDSNQGRAPTKEQPNWKTHKVTLQRYRDASAEVLSLLLDHCQQAEKASIDEVYFDLTAQVASMVLSLLDEGPSEAGGDPETQGPSGPFVEGPGGPPDDGGASSASRGLSEGPISGEEGCSNELASPPLERDNDDAGSSPSNPQTLNPKRLFPALKDVSLLPSLEMQQKLLPVLRGRLMQRFGLTDPEQYARTAAAARRGPPPTGAPVAAQRLHHGVLAAQETLRRQPEGPHSAAAAAGVSPTSSSPLKPAAQQQQQQQEQEILRAAALSTPNLVASAPRSPLLAASSSGLTSEVPGAPSRAQTPLGRSGGTPLASTAGGAPVQGGISRWKEPVRPRGPNPFGETYSAVLSLEEWDIANLWLVCGAVLLALVRRDVLHKLKFTMSGAVAHNKFMAKVASAHFKPNQQVIVPAAFVSQFLSGLELKKLAGLGGKRGSFVSSRLPNCKLVGHLQRLSLQQLQQALGAEQGSFLYSLVRGAPVGSDVVRSNIRVKSMLAFKSLPAPGAPPGGPLLLQWLRLLSGELHDRASRDFRLYRRMPKTLTLHYSSIPPANQKLSRTCQVASPSPAGGGSSGGPLRGPPSADTILQLATQLLTRLVAEQQKQGAPLKPCLRVALALGDFADRGDRENGDISGFFTARQKRGALERLGAPPEGDAKPDAGPALVHEETPQEDTIPAPPQGAEHEAASAGEASSISVEGQDNGGSPRAPARHRDGGAPHKDSRDEGPHWKGDKCISVSSEFPESNDSEEEAEVVEIIDVSRETGRGVRTPETQRDDEKASKHKGERDREKSPLRPKVYQPSAAGKKRGRRSSSTRKSGKTPEGGQLRIDAFLGKRQKKSSPRML
ncbi:hypothetical protein Esti_004678 [Eimeria stiedai]